MSARYLIVPVQHRGELAQRLQANGDQIALSNIAIAAQLWISSSATIARSGTFVVAVVLILGPCRLPHHSQRSRR
jgi:hypothetical protein